MDIFLHVSSRVLFEYSSGTYGVDAGMGACFGVGACTGVGVGFSTGVGTDIGPARLTERPTRWRVGRDKQMKEDPVGYERRKE